MSVPSTSAHRADPPVTIAGLVLAAGEGRRFGGPKAPYVVDGERLVDRAVRVLSHAGCAPVVVVLGAWVDDVPGADVVVNPDWSSGMGSSLRRGLEHLAARAERQPDVDAALVTLVDLPGLTAEAVQRVVDGVSGDPRAALVSATYDGERGHPVLLGRHHWAGAAASAAGDRGARAYLAGYEVTLVEVADLADGHDLDSRPTPPSDL